MYDFENTLLNHLNLEFGNGNASRGSLVLLERTLINDFFKGKIHMICPRILPPMNSTKFLSNGFQGLLKETHRWAMCALSHINGWIFYWNLTTLRTMWMIVQRMSIS
jgi:hypothetical protein